MSRLRACALIPAYNEGAFIGPVVQGARRHVPVWVVDDGSDDDTSGLAEQAGGTVHKHARRMGKGASLREGFQRLIGSFDVIVTLDGDGQHDPDQIPELLIKIEEADLVRGRRRFADPMPTSRRFSNSASSLLLSAVLRRRIADVHCGFRAYRCTELQKLKIHSAGFTIEVELLMKAVRARWRIVDHPVRTLYGCERSKIAPVSDAMHFLKAAMVYGLGLDL